MTQFLKSDLIRNFAIGFLMGAAVLAFGAGDSFIPAAIAGVIS